MHRYEPLGELVFRRPRRSPDIGGRSRMSAPLAFEGFYPLELPWIPEWDFPRVEALIADLPS
jgi:hypothetical protein